MSETGKTRRNIAQPKGRPIDETARDEVAACLGQAPRRRDLLIEHLHALQTRFGALHARHLRALAEEMRLSQAEIFEVASFYHHFDLVKEGEPAPPALTIRVCDSLSCRIAGAEQLLTALQSLAAPEKIRVVRASCIGQCDAAPAVALGHRAIGHARAETILAEAARPCAEAPVFRHIGFEDYCANGGYRFLKLCRADSFTPDSIMEKLLQAGLRGLGGAGFPAGQKWRAVRGFPAPRYVTVNADEGEPGTFKDRHFLETDPHRMLEGALIAAWAVQASRVVIYLRDEYPQVRAILERELAALTQAGLVADGFIALRRGAGAYICGEESAMIESIEGKRGLPRHRPPYIAECGLFGRPTLNHNVETLHWIRDILEKGPDWFASQGKPGHKGLRAYSVSGRVRAPGVKIAPAGITANELIADYCGGMVPGHRFAAYLPGGASGGILPAHMGDIPLDFGGRLAELGCFVGSHALVVLSDHDDVRDAAKNLMAFFARESCGQCTPCRDGTAEMLHLLETGDWDEARLADLEVVMRDASICGLGQAAPNPVRSILNFFREGMA